MEVGSKIVFFSKADDFSTAIAEALLPSPTSSIKKTVRHFDLSLEKYGIKDQMASGEIVNFVDLNGSIQVTVLLLQKYEPPITACAVNEVLRSIVIGESSLDFPTLILPFIETSQRINKEIIHPSLLDQKVAIYGAQIGNETDFTRSMISGSHHLPSSWPISCESMACLLQLVRVLDISTVILAGLSTRTERSAEQDYLATCEIGSFLASLFNLHFFKEKICLNSQEKRVALDPWHALYG